MPRTHQAYPQELRQRLVELVHAGRTPEELAQEYEPSAGSIRNWVAQGEHDTGQRSDGLNSEERQELRRLRRENKQLRIERDILKKQRLGSLGRATRSRRGIPVREGESGRLAGAHRLPGAGSLPQRLLRMGGSRTVGAGTPGSATAGADQRALGRQPAGVWTPAHPCRVAGVRPASEREAGRAPDAARRHRRGQPQAAGADHHARGACRAWRRTWCSGTSRPPGPTACG